MIMSCETIQSLQTTFLHGINFTYLMRECNFLITLLVSRTSSLWHAHNRSVSTCEAKTYFRALLHCVDTNRKKRKHKVDKWIITTSDKHIQTEKSVCSNLAAGALISTLPPHLWTAAKTFIDSFLPATGMLSLCVWTVYASCTFACSLIVIPFFPHKSWLSEKKVNRNKLPVKIHWRRQCLKVAVATFNNCLHLTSFIVIDDFWEHLSHCLTALNRGNRNKDISFYVCHRLMRVKDGRRTFTTLDLSDVLAARPLPVLFISPTRNT